MDLRLQSLINSQRKNAQNQGHDFSDASSFKSGNRDQSFTSIDWSFSGGESSAEEEEEVIRRSPGPGILKAKARRLASFNRSPSISFADVDEVLEVPPQPTESPLRSKRTLTKSPSVTWNFSDEEEEEEHSSVNFGPPPLELQGQYERKKSLSLDDLSLDPRALLSGDSFQKTNNPELRTRKNAAIIPAWALPKDDEATSHDTDKLISAQLSVPGRVINGGLSSKSDSEQQRSEDKILSREELSNFTLPIRDPDELDYGRRTTGLSRFNSFSSLKSMKSTVEKMKGGISMSKITKQSDNSKLNLVVAFFFLSIVGLLTLAHVVYFKHLGEIRLFDQLRLEEAERRMLLFTENDDLIIESRLGVTFPPDVHPYPCIDPDNLYHEKEGDKKRCLEWKGLARLTIRHLVVDYKTHCYSLSWESLKKDVSPMDCFPVINDDEVKISHGKHKRSLEHSKNQGHWYGGGENLNGAWPLEQGKIQLSAFVTGDEGKTEWGNLIKKYFLNSRGLSLTIEDHTPLFVSLNDPDDNSGLCIQARFDDFAYFYHRFDYPKLNYTVCTDKSIVKLHRQFLPKAAWTGQSQNDLYQLHNILKKEIWQVPAFEDMSHDRLVQYIEKVIGYDASSVAENKSKAAEPEEPGHRGYLLLNYHWQKNMGDFFFNPEAFPNVNKTLEFIRKAGLTLVLTVNPFISTTSRNFQSSVRDKLFVQERNSTKKGVPALTWFKDAESCGLLDITKETTKTWLQNQMRRLVNELGEDISFFVDSGNTFHTPTYFEFERPLDNPDLYRDEFLRTMMKDSTVIGVSSAASKRPKAPAFVFMTPMESGWNNLNKIVPNILHLSVIDYPFVNPGPVGGLPKSSDDAAPVQDNTLLELSDLNDVNFGKTKEEIERTRRYPDLDEEFELYLRWWQLNTFMPVLHFLKPPTAFPIDMVKPVFHKLLRIRNEVVVPRLLKFANEAFKTSTPIIRPLWMFEYGSEDAQAVDDEFLLGDELLVAPVLHFGQRTRDVYLPKYQDRDEEVVWRRASDGKYFKGGEWVRNIPVGLNDVLYFIRDNHGVSESENGL